MRERIVPGIDEGAEPACSRRRLPAADEDGAIRGTASA